MLLEGDADESLLTRKALLTAAVYRLHCQLRRGQPILDWQVLRGACRQALNELAGGHLRAMKAIDRACIIR